VQEGGWLKDIEQTVIRWDVAVNCGGGEKKNQKSASSTNSHNDGIRAPKGKHF
jgi:hypothetical protein